MEQMRRVREKEEHNLERIRMQARREHQEAEKKAAEQRARHPSTFLNIFLGQLDALKHDDYDVVGRQ